MSVRVIAELAALVEKMVLMNKKDALIHDVLVNPFFLYRIRDELPDLRKHGFWVTITETETADGRLVGATIRKDGDVFDLGTVLISEEGVEPISGLRNYMDLVRFIKVHEEAEAEREG
jgi:hypothetical protein